VHVIAHTDCAAFDGDADAAVAEAVDGAGRVEAVLPNVRAQSGLLDVTTGSLR
jgi:hypothetical protein